MDDTTVAIPLRSWIIRSALLWVHGLEEDDRLAWARAEVSAILGAAYQQALNDERLWMRRASAHTLPDEQVTALCKHLPQDVAKLLMPHQWVAVKALAEHPQTILADEQGLGKTIEILATLEATDSWPAVVLAPVTALLNWRDEVARWLPQRRVAILGGTMGKRERGLAVAEADLVLINFASFSKHGDQLASRGPKALVVDEAHHLKEHDSQRTKAVTAFCRHTRVERRILATGTPVMNRPAELLTLLTLVPDLLAELGGFTYFAARFCRATLRSIGFNTFMDFSGAGNLGDLANRIRETSRFVRRDKSMILAQLPPKAYRDVRVELQNREEYCQAENDFKKWLRTHNTKENRRSRRRNKAEEGADAEALLAAGVWAGIDELRLEREDRHEALRQIGVLRQLVGRGKITAAIERIRAIVKDEKLVVFAYHIDVQQALIKAADAAGLEPLSITGKMSIAARHKNVRSFQTDPDAKLIVCSITAAQTAINLHAARHVLFVELDWTPSTLAQAEDRLHRIGQTQQVIVTRLRAPDTLDDRMVELLRQKQAIITELNASYAPYGYRKDGEPRKRPPGPGRPALSPDERQRRRKASKNAWQSANKEYMRNYMRRRRTEERIMRARRDIEDYEQLQRLGFHGLRRETDDPYLTQSDYEHELAEAQKAADKAREALKRLGISLDDESEYPPPATE